MARRIEHPALAQLLAQLHRPATRRAVTRATAGAAGLAAASPLLAAQAAPGGGGARGGRRAAQSTPEAMFEEIPAENEGGTLILQNYGDGNSMNPLLWDGAGGPAMELIFQALLRANPETGELEPALAESWAVAEDGVTWTFTLREGVTWHDGTPFTAADVVFSYEIQMDPALGSFALADITDNLAAITAPDERTVVMTATEVNSQFLNLGLEWLAPVHIWGDVAPADIAGDPGSTAEDLSRVIGTGPFRLVERVPQDRTTVERYDGYWGGTPHVETVIAQYTPDLAGAEQLLRTGDHDWGWGTFQSADQLRELENLTLFEYYSLDLVQIGLNLANAATPFFADPLVRQAMLFALDRQAIVDSHYRGFASVANRVLLPHMWAMDEEGFTGPEYGFDPERAAALLDEAGWTVGADGIREKDGVRLAFTFADNEYFSGILSIAQEMWRAVGIEATVELITWELLDEQITSGEWQAAIIYLSVRGSGFQGLNLDLNSANAPAAGNYASFQNERVDELLGLIREELDREAQIASFTELQNIYFAELPYLPIAHDFDLRVVNNRVRNMYPNPYSLVYNAQDWWIAPE